MTPAVIAGGSGGARVSLLTASRHPEDGGRPGHLVDQRRRLRPACRWRRTTAAARCGAAWTDGMEAVADLPEWEEVQERNPSNRERFLARTRPSSSPPWSAGCWPTAPATTSPCPGLPDADAAGARHPGAGLPQRRQRRRTTPGPPRRHWPGCCRSARLVEPPWGDREWIERAGSAGGRPVRPLAAAGADPPRVAGRGPGLNAVLRDSSAAGYASSLGRSGGSGSPSALTNSLVS